MNCRWLLAPNNYKYIVSAVAITRNVGLSLLPLSQSFSISIIVQNLYVKRAISFRYRTGYAGAFGSKKRCFSLLENILQGHVFCGNKRKKGNLVPPIYVFHTRIAALSTVAVYRPNRPATATGQQHNTTAMTVRRRRRSSPLTNNERPKRNIIRPNLAVRLLLITRSRATQPMENTAVLKM